MRAYPDRRMNLIGSCFYPAAELCLAAFLEQTFKFPQIRVRTRPFKQACAFVLPEVITKNSVGRAGVRYIGEDGQICSDRFCPVLDAPTLMSKTIVIKVLGL